MFVNVNLNNMIYNNKMECTSCKKIFKTKIRYETHIQKCNDTTTICFICSKQFSTIYIFKRHFESCKNNISKIQHNMKQKELDYEKQIQELRQQLEQERKDFKTAIREKEIIIESKNNETRLIKELNKSNKPNKTYNVVNITNNNFGTTGISSQELEKEFTEFFTRFPYLVTEKTFHKLLVNSSSIKQNLYINDQSRGITSYFDADEQRIVKDTRMKNLTKKSVECIGPNLSQQMIDFAETRAEDDELTSEKSKTFVQTIVQNKNTESNLLRESENKTYDKLKNIIPNNTDIDKLKNILCEISYNNILTFIFSTWEDIGFIFGKSLKEKYAFALDAYEISIEKTKYRRSDFQKIIYSIYDLLLTTHELIITALIKSDFNKLGYTQLSGKDLSNFIHAKRSIDDKLFTGLQNCLDLCPFE